IRHFQGEEWRRIVGNRLPVCFPSTMNLRKGFERRLCVMHGFNLCLHPLDLLSIPWSRKVVSRQVFDNQDWRGLVIFPRYQFWHEVAVNRVVNLNLPSQKFACQRCCARFDEETSLRGLAYEPCSWCVTASNLPVSLDLCTEQSFDARPEIIIQHVDSLSAVYVSRHECTRSSTLVLHPNTRVYSTSLHYRNKHRKLSRELSHAAPHSCFQPFRKYPAIERKRPQTEGLCTLC